MWNFIIGIGLQILSYLLAPKPPEPKAATLSDFDIPKSKEGDEVPRIYGTAWCKAPQVHWFGNLKTKKIKASGGKK